jgi:hypothetical protein
MEAAGEQGDYETWGRLSLPLFRGLLRGTEEHSPDLAGAVAVVEEYLPLCLEDPANLTAEDLGRFQEAVNHLARVQREMLQEAANDEQ